MIAQLGERQTEDLKVAGSSPAQGTFDIMAEWLRRWTANPLGSARVGSNPADVDFFCSHSSVGFACSFARQR